MKYAIVFILGLAPLGLQVCLCSWKVAFEEESSWRLPVLPVPPAVVKAGDPSPWQVALNELGGPEMFHPAIPPAVLPEASATQWKSAWQRSSRAWAIAQASMPLLRRRTDGDYPQLAAAVQEMEGFTAQYDLDAEVSDGRLRDAWKQRVARFLLAAARAAQDSERYQECVELCEKLQAAHGDAAEAGQAAALKTAALFCQAAGAGRKDLANIGRPQAAMSSAESVAVLNRRREQLKQIVDQHRGELQANQTLIPAGVRREFACWERELKEIAPEIERFEDLVESEKREKRRREAEERDRARAAAAEYCSRADAARSKGQFELAMLDYDHAIQIDPSSADAHRGRDRARANAEKAKVKAEAEKAARVKAEAEKAARVKAEVEKARSDAAEYCSRGDAAIDNHQFEQAISDYDHAIRIDASNADAYYGLGRARYKAGVYDQAAGRNDQAAGRYHQAVTDLTEAIRLHPTKLKLGLAYRTRGYAYKEQGRKQEADEDFATADDLLDGH